MPCQNPRHKEHVKDFVRKFPTAKGRVPNATILVDPKDWAISLEDPEVNTTECCRVWSISEDIIRAGQHKNEPDRYCSCQQESGIVKGKLGLESINKQPRSETIQFLEKLTCWISANILY